MKPCPCQSNKSFADCCEPYIKGIKTPPTPEALMRSRYSAYALNDFIYIDKTQSGKAAEGYDVSAAQNYAGQAHWLGLTVIDSEANENDGQVEFMAFYAAQGKQHMMHERSNFKKIDDRWFYTDGQLLKTGRNDACPCQSGKKFKKCCGKSL